MVRKYVFALAAALALVAPSAAQAQIATGTLTSGRAPGLDYLASASGFSGVGGGFVGEFNSPGLVITFDEFLFWCIDDNRGAVAGPAPYELWTAGAYAAANPFGWSGSVADRRERTRRIASGVNDMINAGEGAANRAGRNAGQEVAWDNFDNAGSSLGNSAYDFSMSYVLVSQTGKQTFMFQTDRSIVPEPASLALMASGLLGFGIIARRRKA